MSLLKNELSKKSECHISKHRYLELLHFCLQYSEWSRAADELLNKGSSLLEEKYGMTNDISDPVAWAAMKRESYLKKKELVRNTCYEIDEEAGGYLLLSVSGGYTYDQLCSKYEVLPVGRTTFYKMYRKFFWLLDKKM